MCQKSRSDFPLLLLLAVSLKGKGFKARAKNQRWFSPSMAPPRSVPDFSGSQWQRCYWPRDSRLHRPPLTARDSTIAVRICAQPGQDLHAYSHFQDFEPNNCVQKRKRTSGLRDFRNYFWKTLIALNIAVLSKCPLHEIDIGKDNGVELRWSKIPLQRLPSWCQCDVHSEAMDKSKSQRKTRKKA